ncbi:PIR protein, partial [Plasmodium vivax]
MYSKWQKLPKDEKIKFSLYVDNDEITDGFIIKELPSERFYQWLDDYFISTSLYYGDCNTLSYPYKNNQKIRKICEKVVKYIKSRPRIASEEHLNDHHCNLFNYWIYEQLVNEYDDKSMEPVQIFGNFHRVLSGFTYYPKDVTCKLDNSIPTIPDRKERKELYEYCIDYDTILEKYKPSTDKCNKYCTYVKNKIQFYEKFQELCTSSDIRKCPDFFFKICENKDPKNLLVKLKCDDIGVRDKSSQEDASGITSNSSPSNESVSNFGNAFLGVVLTSMTSGFLYK